jgi:hypothetical protein
LDFGGYDRDTSLAKLTHTSGQVSPDSLLGVSAGICQRALVYESKMIRTQMGTHRSENGRSAWDALYNTFNLIRQHH